MSFNDLFFRIATDNHLGYMERDPERGADAMKTFEEILKKAKKHKVCMILTSIFSLYKDSVPLSGEQVTLL